MGIDHVHLHVSDAERAARFYRDALGAVEQFRVGSSLVFMSLPAGAVIALDGRPERERNPAHFGVELGPELDEAVAAIERAGGHLVERGHHAPEVPYAYVADPDGNVFEL